MLVCPHFFVLFVDLSCLYAGAFVCTLIDFQTNFCALSPTLVFFDPSCIVQMRHFINIPLDFPSRNCMSFSLRTVLIKLSMSICEILSVFTSSCQLFSLICIISLYFLSLRPVSRIICIPWLVLLRYSLISHGLRDTVRIASYFLCFFANVFVWVVLPSLGPKRLS